MKDNFTAMFEIDEVRRTWMRESEVWLAPEAKFDAVDCLRYNLP
jgi:hypothetical protein